MNKYLHSFFLLITTSKQINMRISILQSTVENICKNLMEGML